MEDTGIHIEVWQKEFIVVTKRFLNNDHPYRCNRYRFRKNSIEEEEPPVRLNSHQIWERVRHLRKIIEVGRSIRIPDYGLEHN